MDKFFGLTYHTKYRTYRGINVIKYEFLTREGNTFGTMEEDDVFFPSFSEYEKLDDLFGYKTDELLLQYLRDKFGDEIIFRKIA